MMDDEQNIRHRNKAKIMADLLEIGIFEKHRRQSLDDQVSFNDEKAYPNPYPRVLVFTISIARVTIPKILVDTGSTLNILYAITLKWMGIINHFILSYSNMILKINGALTRAKGSIKLTIEAGNTPRLTKLNAEFVVFDLTSPYDAIMGQSLLFSHCISISLLTKVLNALWRRENQGK